MALTVKVLNLLLAKYHFVARSTFLVSRPFGLIVDPSIGCNLACPGCVHSTSAQLLRLFDWDKGVLSEERFSALLNRYGRYAVQIMFCNYGEPSTNMRTPQFIDLAMKYLIQTALSTNLTIGRSMPKLMYDLAWSSYTSRLTERVRLLTGDFEKMETSK